MGFAVGMRVLCVDDIERHIGDIRYKRGLSGLTKGRVYTVRRFDPYHYDGVSEAAPTVWLEEITRRHDPRIMYEEQGFLASRFRPLDESRLTVFRQMLVTPPTKELVEDHLDASIADCERAVREALGF